METELRRPDTGYTEQHDEKHFGEDGTENHGEVWTAGAHPETSAERSVRKVLRKRHFFFGTGIALFLFLCGFTGYSVYLHWTDIDSVCPDYTSLKPESDTYWSDRTQIDIETAQPSSAAFNQRIRRFVFQTLAEAQAASSAAEKARAVTDIAAVLFRHNINIGMDEPLQQLGDTGVIVPMRCRAMVLQALMFLRLEKRPAAKLTILQYHRLRTDAGLTLNSAESEESFFGAVTVLKCLGEEKILAEMFNREILAASSISAGRRMRAYRLIAGEQVRTGYTMEAWETSKRIKDNQTELARAWELILQYAARPPKIELTEPVMLELPVQPAELPLQEDAEKMTAYMTGNIFQLLADKKDTEYQLSMLQRIAGSRLMCDAVMHEFFRSNVRKSGVLDADVRQQILNLLDNPNSPAIRAALKMPSLPQFERDAADSAVEDWGQPDETVMVRRTDVDSSPLYVLADRRLVQVYTAIGRSYLSVKRYQDADRVLQKASAAAQKISDASVRTQMLLRIGEQQAAAGLTAGFQKTLTRILLSGCDQEQTANAARSQITARFLDDAGKTVKNISPSALRDDVCRSLLQEQIRIRRLDDAAKTLSLMSDSKTAGECRSLLKIAQGTGDKNDYDVWHIPSPKNLTAAETESACIEYMRNGLLRLAAQTAAKIEDSAKRAEMQNRIVRTAIQIYNFYNDVNDPDAAVRGAVRAEVSEYILQMKEPLKQAAMTAALLTGMTGQTFSEKDRTAGKRMWTQALDDCRKITVPEEKAELFARLIVLKNMLEKPLHKTAVPFFTKESAPSAYAETDKLIQECADIVNSADNPMRCAVAGVFLAKAFIQVGRSKSAASMLEFVQEMTGSVPDAKERIPLVLTLVSLLKGSPAEDWIRRFCADAVSFAVTDFSGRQTGIDMLDWRMRDSLIENIIRAQMENGFMDDAVTATACLNDPTHKDRLLRAAAYIYLDNGDAAYAEFLAKRLTHKDMRQETVQNVQLFRQRIDEWNPPEPEKNFTAEP
ncbi:MAG: hypothetical protein LBH00_03595 [Planctomycetaceae bacterium]|jgi:hypothetical protein|nr:hypothetical protein [Planctomycetaceae bacterium]